MFQILNLLNLTGGMTQKCQGYLVALHTPAIICDTYHLFAAVCNLHCYSSCSCINCILHKLLHNRGWTFHYLTGSDLIYGLLV